MAPPAPAFATVEVPAEAPDAAAHLRAGLRDAAARAGGLAHVLLFASPELDLARLAAAAAEALPGTPVSGCTTAGEIGAGGFVDGGAVALGLPAAHFATLALAVEGLGRLDADALTLAVAQARARLARAHAGFDHGLAFVLVDGLSMREDGLMAALAPAMGDWPVFGGSAADGARFERTLVLHEGRPMADAAVIVLMRTDHRLRVFSTNHLRPTERRMVVTRADPARRLVQEINAEPAAREYARMVGLDPGQLDEFAFAAHPVAVRLGDRHHVRAIQRVTREGELAFFSAVDEGMVLTVTEAEDMVAHLDRALGGLAEDRAPTGILGCDCILRRIGAERLQQGRAVSDVLARHGVVGFSTYGEQIGPIHQNQTLTGVAFYPARDVS
jgi:hypothetical protein